MYNVPNYESELFLSKIFATMPNHFIPLLKVIFRHRGSPLIAVGKNPSQVRQKYFSIQFSASISYRQLTVAKYDNLKALFLPNLSAA